MCDPLKTYTIGHVKIVPLLLSPFRHSLLLPHLRCESSWHVESSFVWWWSFCRNRHTRRRTSVNICSVQFNLTILYIVEKYLIRVRRDSGFAQLNLLEKQLYWQSNRVEINQMLCSWPLETISAWIRRVVVEDSTSCIGMNMPSRYILCTPSWDNIVVDSTSWRYGMYTVHHLQF